MWMWTQNERKKILASATASEPVPAAIRCAIHPSIHPAPHPLWRWYYIREVDEAQRCRTSRRDDSMTNRRASPVVHCTHGVPDVPMDGGRIYEEAGRHHDKMRRDREGVKDEGGRQRQRQGR
jgi:hypothetical protein